VLNLLYFYISTFRSTCAVPNIITIIIITNVIRYSPNGPCHTAYSEVTMKEIVQYYGQGVGERIAWCTQSLKLFSDGKLVLHRHDSPLLWETFPL